MGVVVSKIQWGFRMSREERLESALQHIIHVAKRSRTGSKRLLWIQKRAEDCLNGVDYDRETFVLPASPTKTPAEYEKHIRFLKRELHSYKNMGIIQRILFLFRGAKND